MTFSKLLERLEGATGPDRELDEAIALALCDEHRFMQLADAPAGVGCEMYRFGHHAPSSALRVTASLDAALALVERVLPGWTVANIGQDDAKRWWSELREGYQTSFMSVTISGPSPTPALALLTALLRSLIAKDGRQMVSDEEKG